MVHTSEQRQLYILVTQLWNWNLFICIT